MNNNFIFYPHELHEEPDRISLEALRKRMRIAKAVESSGKTEDLETVLNETHLNLQMLEQHIDIETMNMDELLADVSDAA